MGYSSADDDAEVVLILPSDFPYEELEELAGYLEESNVFVPGYIPPEVGLYNLDGFIHRVWVDERETILLPDRNVVSRLAQIAKGGSLAEKDREQRKKAAAILAFSQCLDITIEPSVAFHELAPTQGNDAAHDELAWFRVADNGKREEWLAIALGQSDQLETIGLPHFREPVDLAKPLRRWRRNYVVILKIGLLELTPNQSGVDRLLKLFEWMYSDFILAGPAAIFACLYFAPLNPPRKGLLKSLRSPDRVKALNGIKNAAWDVTHISEFARKVNEESDENPTRYIFATLDEGLRTIANLVIRQHPDTPPPMGLALSLQQWWPEKEALRIAAALYEHIQRTRDPAWWDQFKGRDYVGSLIEEGERAILEWRSS